MHRKTIVAALACLLLAGCATIISGRSQEMTINTAPKGARCDIVRVGKGDLVARVVTPQTIRVPKTKYDLRITCRKPGFQETTYLVKSKIADATWGNIVLGGGIGWAVDSIGGADNKYERYVNITLPPVSAPNKELSDQGAVNSEKEGATVQAQPGTSTPNTTAGGGP